MTIFQFFYSHKDKVVREILLERLYESKQSRTVSDIFQALDMGFT